ncbi:hypothetical protein Tsubulata_039778 [Turnera subulata]|uniref:Uncharacterized protein n=1 Tax=Turnera subulata TaxID=218843 RepID=A0A9Q0FLT4_9ROSI|nr:hypothetical protein Tsubulata_039778 [Turnera subulata]
MPVDYLPQWSAWKRKNMPQSYGAGVSSAKSEGDSGSIEWSNELDHLPLTERRKLLATRNPTKTSPRCETVVKRENGQCSSQGLVSPPPGFSSSEGKDDAIRVDSGVVDQYAKYSENDTGCLKLSAPLDCSHGQIKLRLHSSSDKVTCSAADFNSPDAEEVNANHCTTSGNQMLPTKSAEMKVESFDHPQNSIGGGLSGSAGADVHALKINDDVSNDDLDHIVLKERQRMLLERKMLRLEKPSSSEENLLESKSFDSPSCMPTSRDNIPSSMLFNMVTVKDEPVDCNGSNDPGRNAVPDYFTNFTTVKNEFEIPSKFESDNVDHVKLQDRMKQQTRERVKLNISANCGNSRKIDSSAVDCGDAVFEAPDPIRIFRPRKRKKTATDSIETALEEDAPGLLGVLIEQGVSIDEIKLYGEEDNDEPIDESFIEEGFADLEAVMSKIFFNRSSLLKLAPLRCSKGTKPSYCLACLFSLVEQARYLQFRNWPAEWGWCRDLQSFIFVFEKHKRIVLERPEYGYATYFFELVDSVSIDWQIKRLVTAMKLTNCGRITLIENKALLVGEDITEGEAQVLMQFGWVPNSGLGTMLNYCDRVVHDRKQEKDTSEWRSKIGKLLMDGYNGGTIVSTSILTDDVVDYTSGGNPQIKMEL